MIGVSKGWISALGVFWWAVSLGSVSCGYRDLRPRTIRTELAAALGAVRPSPGRISGLRYAPLARTYSPPKPTRDLQAIDLRVRRKAERLRSAVALGDRAVLDLAANRLDRAITDLEDAVQQAPADARLLSDLSASYLARGDRGDPFFYVKALTLAQRARHLDRSAEVLFNWALSLERNFLYERASAAWTDYLRFDSDSLWAQEANEHLTALGRPSRSELWSRLRIELDRAALRRDGQAVRRITAGFPFRSRKYAEEELLPGWAEAFVAGRNGEAAKFLEIARWVGQALVSADGECLIADAIAAIDEASREGRVTELASTLHAFGKGRALCQEDRGIEGMALLLRVRAVGVRTRSPIPELGEFHLAGCLYARTRYREAISLLEKLVRQPRIEKYPGLLGRMQWLRGMAYLSLGEPTLSLRSYEAAVTAFEKAGTAEEIGTISYIVAGNDRYLGDMPAAWKWLFRGLTETVRSGEVRALYSAFNEFADETARQGQGEAALLFRSEVIRLAFREGDAPGITYALLRFGQAHWNLGHRAQSLRAFAAAKRICPNR
jgi:tetratricopeptide (TPR) repeat protein